MNENFTHEYTIPNILKYMVVIFILLLVMIFTIQTYVIEKKFTDENTKINDIEYSLIKMNKENEKDKEKLEQTSNPNYLQDNGAVVNNRRITVLAFRNRFTGTEKITLEIAALDNPNAPMQQRQMAAMLRVYTKDTDVATFIDLDRKETRDGIFLLEQYGIIGAGRAVQILDNIITEAERPMNSNFS